MTTLVEGQKFKKLNFKPRGALENEIYFDNDVRTAVRKEKRNRKNTRQTFVADTILFTECNPSILFSMVDRPRLSPTWTFPAVL